MQNIEELVDAIGSAVSEFNYETGEDNFEITITVKCENGFVSEESYEVKDLMTPQEKIDRLPYIKLHV